MMKCFSKLTYTMGAFSDLDFGLRIAQKATEHGVDAFSAPQTMAFAIELYEAGILTDEDLPGMPADNEGRFYWLLDTDRPAGGHRRRPGRRHLLGGREDRQGRARSTRTTTSRRPSSCRSSSGMLNPIYFLMYCTGEKINITQIEGNFPQAPFPTQRGAGGVRRGLGPRPRREVQGVVRGLGAARRELDSATTRPPRRPARSSTGRRRCTTSTTAPGCAPGCRPSPASRRSTSTTCPTLISAGAGLDLDEDGLTHLTRRNRNLVRANNIRRGMTASGREAAGGPLEEAVPRARGEAPGRVLQVQGLEPRRHPHARDPARAGPGLRGRGLPAAGDPDGGRGGPSQEASSEGSAP